MQLKNTLLISSILLLSFCSAVGAGQKLYSFDGFLRESQDRLERLKVARGKLPVYRVPKAIVANPLNPSTRNTTKSIISEFIGGAWIHDPGENNKESDSWDFNAEIVFTKINLVMLCPQLPRQGAGPIPFIVGLGAGEAGGKGAHGLFIQPGHQGQQGGTIDAAGKKHAKRHVGALMDFDTIKKDLLQLLQGSAFVKPSRAFEQ